MICRNTNVCRFGIDCNLADYAVALEPASDQFETPVNCNSSINGVTYSAPKKHKWIAIH